MTLAFEIPDQYVAIVTSALQVYLPKEEGEKDADYLQRAVIALVVQKVMRFRRNKAKNQVASLSVAQKTSDP